MIRQFECGNGCARTTEPTDECAECGMHTKACIDACTDCVEVRS